MFEEVRLATLEIPKELETLKLPVPELLTFYKDIEQRTIWVDSEIDNNLLETVKWILQWNQEDEAANKPMHERKPITMLIHCPGGDLYSTWTCVDVMLVSKTPIITVNMGMAMSGGFMLLIAGSKRYALKHSTGLYHEGHAGFEGTSSHTNSHSKEYELV